MPTLRKHTPEKPRLPASAPYRQRQGPRALCTRQQVWERRAAAAMDRAAGARSRTSGSLARRHLVLPRQGQLRANWRGRIAGLFDRPLQIVSCDAHVFKTDRKPGRYGQPSSELPLRRRRIELENFRCTLFLRRVGAGDECSTDLGAVPAAFHAEANGLVQLNVTRC